MKLLQQMKYFFLPLWLLFISFSILAQPLLKNDAPAASGANTYAIVIGISSYQDPDIPPLSFSNKDAIVFSDFLMSAPGGSVPKKNIKLLTDSMATIGEVDKAIRWLMDNCKQDDKVFFYFSGHGEMENVTMSKNGYLICYNTPSVAFVNMGLSIDYLNDIVNTISVRTKAKVIVITDACHSGTMNGNKFKGNFFVGEQLMLKKENEIRMSSSKPDQLSNEKEDLGGGRGVFSYYLVNGLQGGLADADHDGFVSVGELKNYLENKMANDPFLKSDGDIQTPVINGSSEFQLATVVTAEANKIKEQFKNDSLAIVMVTKSMSGMSEEDNAEPADYFLTQLKKQNLEGLTDSLKLNTLTNESIVFALINELKDSSITEKAKNKLGELEALLKNDKEKLNRFYLDLAGAFLDIGQNVITNYIRGDEAELERRRYYNSQNNGYDVYTRMFTVALNLSKEDKYYGTKAAVFFHYFSGLALRLKIPVTEDPAPLIEAAFAEQKKALELEAYSAYIYNELGVLYMAKKDIAEAEKNFINATKYAPNWALPWANLAYLYAAGNSNKKGFNACNTGDSLQAGLPCISNNFGLLYENTGNQLFAEEYYRASIDLNSRHYLPFERLGYVYLNRTQYALADSFFYEADLRKQGLHFKKGAEPVWRFDVFDQVANVIAPCKLDTAILRKNDVMGFFYWGMHEYLNKNLINAVRIFKKVIDIDAQNPLAFHYLGKIFYEQKKWEDAELMFKYAIQFNLDAASFKQYCDSVIKQAKYPYAHDCFENFFRVQFYEKIEDFYFIATAYETWGHYEDAETMYKAIIQLQPNEIGGYIKRWQMFEKLGRFTETEKLIKNFAVVDKERAEKELNAFYRRTLEKFPDNADWNYRLGILLYSRADAPALTAFLDSIVWFPKINKELFIDTAVLKLINRSGNYTINDLSTTNSKTTLDEIHLVTSHELIQLPGINEDVELALDIYSPRKDGIEYLSRAAELIGEKETLADIYFKIGSIYVLAGSKKQAYKPYAKSLELDPRNANTRLNLVDAGTAIYKNRATLAQLNYLYDSSQINFEKRLLYAQMSMYAGQFNKSQQLLDEARAKHPYNLAEFADLYGRLNLLSNKPDKAISNYKIYVASKPDDANTCYSIARLYAQKKNEKDAFIWLEKSIKLGFNYKFIFELDPVMDNLRKTDKWKTVVTKTAPIKLKRRGIVSDY